MKYTLRKINWGFIPKLTKRMQIRGMLSTFSYIRTFKNTFHKDYKIDLMISVASTDQWNGNGGERKSPAVQGAISPEI